MRAASRGLRPGMLQEIEASLVYPRTCRKILEQAISYAHWWRRAIWALARATLVDHCPGNGKDVCTSVAQ